MRDFALADKRAALQQADLFRAELWYPERASEDTKARQALVQILQKIDKLKPFPVVTQKLLGLLNRPDFEVDQLTAVIEEDPALASDVLRVANSALFGALSPSKSINQAIVRLGVVSLRELIYSASLQGLFQDVGGAGRKIRDHCAVTAALVRLIANRYLPDLEDAFVCGLMHDLRQVVADAGRCNQL